MKQKMATIKRRKSKLWAIWGWIFPRANMKDVVIALRNTIWIDKDLDRDTISINLIAHEQEHLAQQKAVGWFLWLLFYVFSPMTRYLLELKAYTRQIRFLTGTKAEVVLARKKFASIMASEMYCTRWELFFGKRMVKYNRACSDLAKAL